MTKRNLQRLVLLIALGLVGFILLSWWSTPAFRVDQDSFRRIQSGMTASEIAAVLGGGPSGQSADQKMGPWRYIKKRFDVVAWDGPGTIGAWQEWIGNGMGIVVGFDEHGQACAAVHFRFEESLLDRVWRRLHLRPLR